MLFQPRICFSSFESCKIPQKHLESFSGLERKKAGRNNDTAFRAEKRRKPNWGMQGDARRKPGPTWILWEKRMKKGSGLARRPVPSHLHLQENLATKGTARFQAGTAGGTQQRRRKKSSDTDTFFKIMKFTFPKESF